MLGIWGKGRWRSQFFLVGNFSLTRGNLTQNIALVHSHVIIFYLYYVINHVLGFVKIRSFMAESS